jgi:hypothetical protein
MNQAFLIAFIAIAITIGLAVLAAGITTITIPVFAQNTTFGNITDGNSTEILAPSEEGGWG